MWMNLSLSLSRLLGGLAARVQREEGQTMAEYALLIVFIAIVVIVAITVLGNSISSVFNSVAGKI